MAGRPQAQSEWNGHGRSAVYQSDDQQHGDIIILQLGQGWRLIISLFPSLGSGGGGGGQRDTSAETANLSMLKALPVAARAVASCAALCICIRPSRLDGVGVDVAETPESQITALSREFFAAGQRDSQLQSRPQPRPQLAGLAADRRPAEGRSLIR